jgi:hypothetical protein
MKLNVINRCESIIKAVNKQLPEINLENHAECTKLIHDLKRGIDTLKDFREELFDKKADFEADCVTYIVGVMITPKESYLLAKQGKEPDLTNRKRFAKRYNPYVVNSYHRDLYSSIVPGQIVRVSNSRFYVTEIVKGPGKIPVDVIRLGNKELVL